ncbi:MAG: nucleoside deaminase [Candidatus Omnitrophica bacterium]|jgi:tRNA(Arg) A34 adenosine deaminase TadA|nr:nucleoside deaminase [Candidatus Omnitrophota bacterium]
MKRKLPHKKYMQLAICEARKNLSKVCGGPFGACIAKGNKVIAIARNTVLKNDASCHAEINAIRLASKKLRTHDLSGCRIYSTTEPCPMCFAACHWARIGSIIYGNNISDAKKIGFNELSISNVSMKKIGKAKIKVIRGVLRNDCNRLFREWSALPNKQLY